MPEAIRQTLILVGVALAAFVAVRYVVLPAIARAVTRSGLRWDDLLADRRILARIAWLAPLVIVRVGLPFTLGSDPALRDWVDLLERVLDVAIVFEALRALGAVLARSERIYETWEGAADRPINGYLQILLVVAWVFGGVIMVARLADQPVTALLAGLSALSAVILIIFNDTLRSVAASFQIANGRIVRIGDWIEMPSHNVDGEVVDIALHTITVKNWDLSLSTVPTHKVIGEAVKNWDGMTKAGMRRIKRSIRIDLATVRPLSDEDVTRLGTEPLIAGYLAAKTAEVAEWNQREEGEHRSLTNLGTFRAYALAYVRSHPRISQDATLIVRQLPSGEHGVPIEIYAFTDTTDWAVYEGIQADIFDHLLAMLPAFGLEPRQTPAAADISPPRP